MPIRAKITTRGMSETLEELARLGHDIDAAVAAGLSAGGHVLLSGMLQRVPRDTENLANNLSLSGPHQDGNEHYIYVGLNRGVDAETARYGAVQEYGAKDTPAQPYIRPTIDEDMRRARKALMNVLKRAMGGGQ